MTDLTHLTALQTRLSHERDYLAAAKSNGERELRNVWIVQIQKEIDCEYRFLGLTPSSELPIMTDECAICANWS